MQRSNRVWTKGKKKKYIEKSEIFTCHDNLNFRKKRDVFEIKKAKIIKMHIYV